jgi:hypothetical protein
MAGFYPVLIISAFAVCGCGNQNRPKVWMAPPTWIDDSYTLFANEGADWKSVRDRVDVFKFYRQFLAEESDQVLAKAIGTLKKGRIAIAVETSPAKTTPEEIKRIDDRLREHGSRLDYIDLDNTIGILMDAGWIGKTHRVREMERAATPEEAVEFLIAWMKQTYELMPQVKIGMIECVWRYSFDEFPGTDPAKSFKDNNPSHGDLRPIMDLVFKRLDEEGLKLHFFHGEHARLAVMQLAEGYEIDKWAKLKRLEEYFKSRGVEFGILYADESAAWWWPDRVKENADAVVANNMVNNAVQHWANGGRVDHVVLQSWEKQPSKMVPEDQPDTFTNVVKRVLDNFESLDNKAKTERTANVQ